MTRLHNNRRVRGIIPEVHAGRGYDFFFPACMDFFQEAEEIVFLRAGPLGFIAHADPGAMGAGIDDVRVPGRQQGSLVGTAGAVPDIVADIVVKAPVEKTGELVSGTIHRSRRLTVSGRSMLRFMMRPAGNAQV